MRPDGPVVVAVDGSAHSARTLDWGLAEARLRDADVVLARAYQEPREVVQWTRYPALDDLRSDVEVKRYLAEELDRARARFADLTISTRALHGPEVPELRNLSRDAQLLVVGAHGHAGRSRVGRVSAHLAAHTRCPVAVVREPTDDPAAPVLVGVDGSPSSLAAAQTAAREALLRRVPLVVAHARPTITAPFGREAVLRPLSTSDETDPAHRAAQEVAAQLREDHLGLDVRVELLDDDPAHALTQMSRRATLLVVGSRGLGAFRGMLLGSVSNEVVRSAATTVLVVPLSATDRAGLTES